MRRHRTSARRLLGASCAAVLLAGVTACGAGGSTTAGGSPTGPSGTPKAGGSVVIGAGQDMQTFNPALAIDQPSTFVDGWVFDSLFTSSPDGEHAVPALATRIDFSKDGLTATIGLRTGVKFQNGSPMTSKDVEFSLRKLVASPAVGSVYSFIRSISAQGADAVVLTFRHPETDVADLLATPPASIVPANYGGESEDEFQAHPLGTGPYKVVGRTPGVEVRLERNPHYWQQGRPYLDKITYKVYKDVNALSTAFRAGNVDLVNAVPLSALESFSTGVMSYARPSSQTQTLTVNGRSGPLSDVKVRQAISHAIDRGSLVKSLLAGHGAVAGGQLKPAILPIGTKLDGAPYTFDPALSRRLLAESSVKGRATVTLTYSTGDATGAAVAQVLQSDLTKVGITLQLKPLDPAASIAAIVGGKSELGLAQPSASTPTAGGALGFFIQTGGYGGGWDMTKVQSSLDAYTRAHDAQQQAAAVQEFEQYVDSTLPSIALYCPYAAFVAKSNIGGLHVNPLLVYPIQDLWRAQ